MCYANIALVTDYDSGLEGDPNVQPVTAEEVGRTFEANSARLRLLIKELVPQLPHERDCICSRALQGARFSK